MLKNRHAPELNEANSRAQDSAIQNRCWKIFIQWR